VSNGPQIRRVRHETRFRRLTVQQVESLTPTMLRVTVGGEDLAGFVSLGFDDHVKLAFPSPDGDLRLPSPAMRDYTPRRYLREEGRLVLDFFIHESGPATEWAAAARPGQLLGVGGPRGSFIIPTDMDWHLLIGDESALPAIGRRLEELPAGARAIVVAEVDSEVDTVAFQSQCEFQVVWGYRRGQAQGSPDILLNLLRKLDFPAGTYFAWAAAESHVARAVRHHLIAERGADKQWIKAAGYWKRGETGTHDKIEE
jgi:NADPH-dependent ferric siderophore reductase